MASLNDHSLENHSQTEIFELPCTASQTALQEITAHYSFPVETVLQK